MSNERGRKNHKIAKNSTKMLPLSHLFRLKVNLKLVARQLKKHRRLTRKKSKLKKN